MKIHQVSIHHWRSVRESSFYCEELSLFIGQNNHGKSNILSALLFFFGEIKVQTPDFYPQAQELWVEITFHQLHAHEKEKYQDYLRKDGCFVLRRFARRNGECSYRAYRQTPQEAWLQEAHIARYQKKAEWQKLPIRPYLPTQGRVSKEQYREAIRKYCQDHPPLTEYRMEREAFLGADRAAEGKLGEVFFVPAVKDTSEEMNARENSLFGKLLSPVVKEMTQKHEAFRALEASFSSLMEVFVHPSSQKPAALRNLEKQIAQSLETWNTLVEVQVHLPPLEKILKQGITLGVNDGTTTDVSRKGNGLQRSLLFALLKTQRTLQPEKTETPSSRFILYEEPELYLHPQAEKELFATLKTLSKQADTQVFLSTHSSSFVDIEDYRSICIVKKKDVIEGTQVRQCREPLFEQGAARLRFNLSYWINPDRGELFFARKVILVEGVTEKTVIPYLAQQMGVFRYDYTFIDCGNKDNMLTYLVLLNKFHIPYAVVYDQDRQPGKGPKQIKRSDELSAAIEELIIPDLGHSIVFVNDIEEEMDIQSKSRKAFKALQKISEEGYQVPKALAQKIRMIYERPLSS